MLPLHNLISKIQGSVCFNGRVHIFQSNKPNIQILGKTTDNEGIISLKFKMRKKEYLLIYNKYYKVFGLQYQNEVQIIRETQRFYEMLSVDYSHCL